ncbi:unnamed protein product [Withania somnifera]
MFGKPHQTQNFHQSPSQPPPSSSANDGATIEVVRRPRGRPPGSKNKPKPAPTPHDDHMEKPIMSPYILEIPCGVDIIGSTYHFCSKHNIGLCILNGSGTVTNVTLKQPFTNNPDSTITFHGNFNILSISATILPQSIFQRFQMTGPAYLIAASFNNPFYHKFPTEDDAGGQSPHTAVSDGRDNGHPSESAHHEYYCSSNQLPSDVTWAPTTRQLPPY